MPFFNVIVTIVGLVIWIVIIALVIRVGLKFYRKISNIERNVNAILEVSNEDILEQPIREFETGGSYFR